MLVQELPDARLVEASSILELRLSPERLTGEIVVFIDECWEGAGERHAARRRRGSRPNASEAASTASRRRSAS